MKKIILVVSLMFGGATLVAAQDQPSDTRTQSSTETSIHQDQDKEKIAVSELPQEVRSQLESQDFAAWTVGDVYKKTDASQNEIYIVEMTQGSETKKVKFDRDGNKIEGHQEQYGDKSESTQYNDESAQYRNESEEAVSDEGMINEDASDEQSPEYDETSAQDATEHEASEPLDGVSEEDAIEPGATNETDETVGTEEEFETETEVQTDQK